MPGVWPQRGYDGGRTGYNPDAAGVPSGIDERLSFELPSGYDETVTVRDVLVAPDEYVVAGGEVVAGYDRAGGERTWRRWFEHVTGTPVLDGGWVVVGSRDRVHGVERAADRHEWVKRLDQLYGVVSALAGQGGSVYVAGRGGSENQFGRVAVLDPATGALDRGRGTSGVGWLFVTDDHVVYQWSEFFSSGVTVLDTALESERELTGHGGPNPPDDVTRLRPRLVGNGTVYGTEPGDPADELVARDLDSGAVCWRRPLDSGLNAPPAVVRDILYVWEGGGLVARNSHTGDVLWRCDEARRAETDHGSDADESMVAALSSLVLGGERPMAVDPDTGDVLWTREDPFTVHALVDDELVASRGDEVLVFRDGDSSGTNVYGAACPACGADLDGRGAPAFCPDCGASLDG